MEEDKLTTFITAKPKTPFAPPQHEAYIYESNVSDLFDIEKAISIIKSKEDKIKKTYPSDSDGGTGLGSDSLTSRFKYINLFQWPEFNLKSVVKQKHDTFLDVLQLDSPKIYGQSWANIMKKGQKINYHAHSRDNLCYLGGHIDLKTDNTYTNYINPFTYDIHYSKNKSGKITLFSNWIQHGVDKVLSDRITIAFDLCTQRYYDDFEIHPKLDDQKRIKNLVKSHWEKL